jgi:hypothetical protein
MSISRFSTSWTETKHDVAMNSNAGYFLSCTKPTSLIRLDRYSGLPCDGSGTQSRGEILN